MASIYNVTYDCDYDWFDLSTGHNRISYVHRTTQSFSNMESAVKLFDRLMGQLYEAIRLDINSEDRERLNADYYPSLDVYNNIEMGEDLMSGNQGYAWKYDMVDALSTAPNCESVSFELFEAFSVGYEESYKSVATIVLSRVPIFDSIDDFDTFWKSSDDEEGDNYQYPKEYEEWCCNEIRKVFKSRQHDVFPYNYFLPGMDNDEGFFEASWSKEEMDNYLNNE